MKKKVILIGLMAFLLCGCGKVSKLVNGQDAVVSFEKTVCNSVDTLYDAMKDRYLMQIKEMAEVVYSYGLNIDYFPTNFIVQNDEIFYIDFECNNYMDEWNFENWGVKYWSKTQDFIDYMKQH